MVGPTLVVVEAPARRSTLAVVRAEPAARDLLMRLVLLLLLVLSPLVLRTLAFPGMSWGVRATLVIPFVVVYAGVVAVAGRSWAADGSEDGRPFIGWAALVVLLQAVAFLLLEWGRDGAAVTRTAGWTLLVLALAPFVVCLHVIVSGLPGRRPPV